MKRFTFDMSQLYKCIYPKVIRNDIPFIYPLKDVLLVCHSKGYLLKYNFLYYTPDNTRRFLKIPWYSPWPRMRVYHSNNKLKPTTSSDKRF